MPLYVVDTIVTYRMKYVVEADCLDHAYDEVVMKDSGSDKDFFEELTQRHISENIIDGREISREDFEALVNTLKDDRNESCCHWLGDKLIRKIDYKRD